MPDNLNFAWGNTYNFSNAGVVAGTGFSITTTAATNAVINGKFTVPLAVQTNAALPTVDAATGLVFNSVPPGQCFTLVVGVTSGGALGMCQGRFIPSNPGAGTVPGALVNDPQFPGLANDFVALAYTVIRTAAGASAWLPGASAWTAAGVVATPFTNVSQLANRPQAA